MPSCKMRCIILFLGICSFLVNSNAKTTTITADNGVRYILDLDNHTAEVTYKNGFSVANTKSNYTFTDIVIPEKVKYQDEEYLVTSIGDQAFYNCSNLIHIEVPDNIVSIGESAFYKCQNLIAFDFPEELTSIGKAAFYWCSKIESLVFPLKLTELPEIGFEYFYALNYILFPPGISYIGNNSFYTPSTIKDKIICLNPNPIELDGFNVFATQVWNGTKIYVPSGSVDAYKKLNGWNKAKNLLPLKEASSVTINGSEHAVKVGQQLQLEASLLPADVTCDIVEWKVENPEIAKISQKGVVTGVSPGQTNIIAVTLDGSNLTAEYPVTVIADQIVILGDSNDNGIVTVADVITTAYHLVGLPTSGWNFLNADVTQDNLITVADITATTDIILNGNDPLNIRKKISGATNCLEGCLKVMDFTIKPGETFMTSVELALTEGKEVSYAGVQFDIVVPESIVLKDVIAGTALSKYNVSYKERGSGIIRIVVYANGAEATSATDDILYLKFSADSDAQAGVLQGRVSNVFLSDPLGQDIFLENSEFNISVKATEPDEPDEPEPTVEPADTPAQLLRKGDGTSHTFVAMMAKSDALLEAEGYRYVFGYDNLSEGIKVIDDTPWRYAHTSDEIYWNSANDFWVFAYYVGDDGMMHVSSRRHLDGREDDDFNPHELMGFASREETHTTGIYTLDGQYVGKEITNLTTGIYIVRTTNSSYKIVR